MVPSRAYHNALHKTVSKCLINATQKGILFMLTCPKSSESTATPKAIFIPGEPGVESIQRNLLRNTLLHPTTCILSSHSHVIFKPSS